MNYPIELYDLSNCKGVICIFTSGIEKILFDDVKKICLYKLAQFKTNQERDNWNNYINDRFDTSSCSFPETFNEFESILNFVNEFYEGNFEVYNSDELNKEIYEGHLRIVESWFEHICKWIGNEKESQ